MFFSRLGLVTGELELVSLEFSVGVIKKLNMKICVPLKIMQWWKVHKNIYSSTVSKYNFEYFQLEFFSVLLHLSTPQHLSVN